MSNNNNQWRPGRRVAIVGAGPGGVSAAIAMLKQGYDVRIFERNPEPKPLGGAVLLSTPVLAILKSYGIEMSNFGSYTTVEFQNSKGEYRADIPFNPSVEKAFGIKGWYYGVLRSSAFAKMLDLLPEGIIVPGSDFESYHEHDAGISVRFANGTCVEADILVGSDGVRSAVCRQAFGEQDLFHVGVRVWLAWCDPIDGIPPNSGVISHSHKYQASFFPMLHDGKPGYEWWIVEPASEKTARPKDPQQYIRNIVKNWADPIPRLVEATNFNSQIFCWDVYNKPSMKTWSKGRVVCLGDAAHPVSPYAAYGMGMAIEDGYFLAKFLKGRDLSDLSTVKDSFSKFEEQRVAYTNHHVEFARKLGNFFHHMPYPLAKMRDFFLDNTGFLNKMLTKDYIEDSEKMSLSLSELHVN
ncbi:NAD(P)/FAD-dependent oxidoreductase [Pseudomonas sp. Irchel s3b5]|uniref:FAD-dependent oxidoreductase n=1 Tax=Pseudomonas sp. Irchel s3b5 TaxID=2009077 RepID=UPI000BA2ED69|nr:NAD(P)/FAD-dependent oxidoreductase [Pseudomonas sp. Irchel s3b5]